MKINLTSVLVDDQNKALAFYTEVLGFQEKTNVPVGEHSWLTVVSPDDPDGVELVLEPDAHPAAKPFKTRSSPTASRTPRSRSPTSRPNTSGSLLRAWSSPKNRSRWARSQRRWSTTPAATSSRSLLRSAEAGDRFV